MSAFYAQVARFYDAENSDKTDDLAFYSELAARQSSQILDVGCGTGRLLIHLAQGGHSVHGIDSSPAMLARLARKLDRLPRLRDRISFEQGDILRHHFPRRFGLILLSYNLMMHFRQQDEQLALLHKLRACLAVDGKLVIDLPNAGPAFAAPDSDDLVVERRFLDSDSGDLVMLHSTSQLDRSAQLLDVEWIYDSIDGDGAVRRLIVPHQLRYFFLPELRLLLERCGFALDAVYGGMDQSAYAADSERMIVLADGV